MTSSAPLILDHAWRKALIPFKKDAWNKAQQPFWHEGLRGLKFELYPGELIDYYIYTEGLFEKRFLLLIERLFKGASGAALDIGANIGNHTLFLSHVFGEVHAFEPNPAMIARLEANIAANEAPHIQVHSFGLSDSNEFLPFEEATNKNAGSSRFVRNAGNATKTLEVRRGDDVVKTLGLRKIDFMKVDVEGFEIAVLNGLAETIAAHQPAVAFEFHPKDFEPGYFDNFRKALPGYAFFECDLRAQSGGLVADAASFLKNGGLPRLTPLGDIVKTSYPNLLAFAAGDTRAPRHRN
ncbi:MAG: FkbM family methyltransferase [Amphiplicatus sp.]